MHAISLAVALVALPWEGPAFSGDPGAIAAAAGRLDRPGGVDVDILVEEVSLDLDERGRSTLTSRIVYVPLTASAVQGWASEQVPYSPWFQERPELQARVVSRAGEARWLDASALTDAALPADRDRQLFSDRRVLQGPLPGVEPGAVVEEVLRSRDREPFFAPGTVFSLVAARPVPVRKFTLRVAAPRALPLRHEVRGLPPAAVTTEGGRRVLWWEGAPLPAAPPLEPYGPPDREHARGVVLSTGGSWNDVARGYAEIAERSLAGADLVAAARSIVAPGDGSAGAAQKVLDWVATRVRYTSLSLGERSIVPAAPAVTLARGYGDCKDLSLLVVGLLRAAGRPASLALLATGRPDASPELPGLGFDHAIVRVGGATPLWLDPTDPGTPAGQLPPWVQGRSALVADAATTGLARTPEARPGESRWSKVRRVEMPEDGWARASEEGTFWGAAAAHVRRVLVPVGAAEAEQAARARMAAGDGAKVAMQSDGGRGEAPARARFTASASRWARTGDDEAEALAAPHPVFQRLPDLFRTEAVPAGKDSEAPPARREDLVLPEAYRAELRYEIVPPPGFRAVGLPRPEGFRSGPATFDASISVAPDGMVVVTYRFELTRRRLVPAEVETLWSAVAQATKAEGLVVRFRRLSALLLAEGRKREALVEIRRLMALHPSEAMHHLHLARALVPLGLGEAARAEARLAASLEPGSEWAQRVLSYALRHDLLGRPFGLGADMAGAVAAQRRAVELAPRSASSRLWLARLLEQGPLGRYQADAAALDGALAIRRAVRDELKSDEGDLDLASLLLHMGKAHQALQLARDAPPAEVRVGILLAAATAVGGADAVRKELAALPEKDRASAESQAMLLLLSAREYDAVRALASVAPRPSDEASRIARDAIQRLRRRERGPDGADPRGLPGRVLRASFLGIAAVEALTSTRLGNAEAVWRSLGGGGQALLDLGLPVAAIADVLEALVEVGVEGDGSPWRLACKVAGLPGDLSFTLVATLEGGEVRAVAADPNRSELATVALKAARLGDLAAARRLLGWAIEGQTDPVAEAARPLLASGAKPGRRDLELAAYAIANPPGKEDALSMLPRLEEARTRAAGPARVGLSIAAVGAADRAGLPERAAALATEFAGEDRQLEPLRESARLGALVAAGKLAEAQGAAEALLLDRPDALWLKRTLAAVASARGDVNAAASALRRILAAPEASASDYNSAAWNELFREPPAEAMLGWAKKGAEGRGYEALHTLAAAHAWRGEPGEALEALRTAVGRAGRSVRSADWLVVGRIAEEYGMTEAAAAAYRRVEPPLASAPGPVSSAELARRRLRLLEGNLR